MLNRLISVDRRFCFGALLTGSPSFSQRMMPCSRLKTLWWPLFKRRRAAYILRFPLLQATITFRFAGISCILCSNPLRGISMTSGMSNDILAISRGWRTSTSTAPLFSIAYALDGVTSFTLGIFCLLSAFLSGEGGIRTHGTN